MPTTPGCQPSPADQQQRSVGARAPRPSASAAASPGARVSRRSWFSCIEPQRRWPATGPGRRSSSSCGRRGRSADAAAGIDPRPEHEAEMLGARRVLAGRAARRSAASPGWPRRAITLRPCATSARLRPVSGTTSQTVPSATRSSQVSRSGSGRGRAKKPRARSARLSATTSRKATPTAARSTRRAHGRSRFGLTTASAARQARLGACGGRPRSPRAALGGAAPAPRRR